VIGALATALAIGLLALLVVVSRNRALRRRPGNVPVRARFRGSVRWVRGHGVWINDIFAFRRSPAGWQETLLWVTNASACPASEEERVSLHRLGDNPVVATFVLASGGSMAFGARADDRGRLLGPFA
jgi:hypothetical protein